MCIRDRFVCSWSGTMTEVTVPTVAPTMAPTEAPTVRRCDVYAPRKTCVEMPRVNLNKTLPDCLDHAPPGSLRIGIVGDFGLDQDHCEANVGTLVQAVEAVRPLDAVLTLGDNGYWSGSCEDLQQVNSFFGHYFTAGNCTHNSVPDPGALPPKFWPTLGNHDWDAQPKNSSLPYLRVFNYLKQASTNQGVPLDSLGAAAELYQQLLGQWYSRRIGELLEVFCLNSNLGGGKLNITSEMLTLHDAQIKWVEGALKASTARWKVVYFHHPPYTTSREDSTWMQHKYHAWGASVVLNGHMHTYERIVQGANNTYVVNGLGGHPWRYQVHHCEHVAEGSVFRYNSDHGMMFATVTDETMKLCFISVGSKSETAQLIDQFTLR
eukprot:TRINITY_DN33358_c0_g1_i2.p1 TRINITY_DN33358_c0_g1~~TRINITY_DN33358_c0_g1_i2.p1  ORF type:complete len:378 (-),score=57.67 TRINITY_DN33358_c0_g1_i2:98-1231(-)